eukprot:c26145_g1_i1 orf=801-2840(+)
MATDSVVKNSSLQSRRHGLLKDQLRLVKRKDCERFEISPILEPLSFEKGFFLFIRACQLLSQNMEGVVIVGLAGPSGAGKTVFSEKVGSFMPGIAVISMDNYNDSSRIVDGNYDDPRLTDYDLLLKNLNDLKAGRAAEVPIYDYKLSSRTGFRKLELPPSCIVIIEGIYALSEKLRPLLDLRVSVTGGVHFDLVKRVLRDINRSGQAPEDIIHQVSETVYPMYKAFIEPDLETAHIKIRNKFNPFSGLQSPTYILKSSRIVSEEQIRAVLSPDHTEIIEETYDIYLLPPGEDPETCQSYLRMRNRDGRYNLMFEECVTDNPFIISPRISFEVSVRLLGGLMALGYTIATIMKRVSQVYLDEKMCVKIDKLEQLHRKYMQVQGRDRTFVAETAQKLGLEGSYTPHPYIEQIQLEKLTAEVMALPEDLKTKLIIHDTICSSPMPSFSWISEIKPGVKNLYSKSWTRNTSNSISESMPIDPIQRQSGKVQPVWLEVNGKRFDDRGLESPVLLSGGQGFPHFSEQLTGLNERMDELLLRLGHVEAKLSISCNQTPHRQNLCVRESSFGNGSGSLYSNGIGMNHGHSPPRATSNTSALESTVIEEVRMLGQGQRHLTKQLDAITNLLHENISHTNMQKRIQTRGWCESLLGKMKTDDSGLAIAAGLLILGLGGLVSIATLRNYN